MLTDLQGSIGDAITGIINSPVVQLAFKAIAIYVILIWLVTAYWAYRDMQHRSSNPVAPYLAAVGIIVATPILFLFAIPVYKIVRPRETVAESNERALAEEAMLTDIEARPHCANCSRPVDEDWIICPSCRNRLRRVCPNCSRLVELDWSLCAWCGKDFERPEVAAPVYMPGPRPQPQLEGQPMPMRLEGPPSMAALQGMVGAEMAPARER